MSYGSLPYICVFLFLNAFPENLTTTMAIFSLLNLRFNAGRILAISALQAIANLIEFLPINPGVHSIILLLTLAIFTFLFTRAQLSRIFLSVLACWIITIISVMIYLQPLLKLAGLTYGVVNGNPFLTSAFIVPYELLFLVFALAKNHYNRRKGLPLEA